MSDLEFPLILFAILFGFAAITYADHAGVAKKLTASAELIRVSREAGITAKELNGFLEGFFEEAEVEDEG